MKQNIKVAKELIKLAKSLMSIEKKATYGLMFENPDAPKHTGDFPILKIKVSEQDIRNSDFYKEYYKECEEKIKEWEQNTNSSLDHITGYDKEDLQEAKRHIEQITDITLDSLGVDDYIDRALINWIEDIINGLKKLAKKGTTYMSGNFTDWSKYYDVPMKNAQDVINAANDALEALGTFGFFYNFTNDLDEFFYSNLEGFLDEDEVTDTVREIIRKVYP